MERKKITSFEDLEVYQRAYSACLLVMKEIIPKLPPIEKYDLVNQLSRSSKAVPRLIGEGFAKKHQVKGFQKYLDDALTESNETIVGLNQIKDLYAEYVDINLCIKLINEYKIISKQTFKLAQVWQSFTRHP